MNHYRLLSALGFACVAGLSASAQAVTTGSPLPATAASAVPPTTNQRERPVQSPAVRAAQGAAAPGDLRPEHRVVPQIAVPLRGARGSERPGSAAAGEIDDTAARCRAATSDRDRAACTRGGSVPGAPKR